MLIETKRRFYTPHDGEICIARGVVHSLRVVKGEECIFEERTEPMVSYTGSGRISVNEQKNIEY